jgi:hypothetical protein
LRSNGVRFMVLLRLKIKEYMLFGAKMVLCALAFSFAIQNFIFTTNKIIDYYNIFLLPVSRVFEPIIICCLSYMLWQYFFNSLPRASWSKWQTQHRGERVKMMRFFYNEIFIQKLNNFFSKIN